MTLVREWENQAPLILAEELLMLELLISLKLAEIIPIISDVFSKILCDLVDPLPESNKMQQEYVDYHLCMLIPEAIPISNLLSEAVIEVLTSVFSSFGYPPSY